MTSSTVEVAQQIKQQPRVKRVKTEAKKKLTKEQRELFPVLPITFYSGPTTTVYTITDPDDPLVVSKQQLRNERDVTVSYNVGDLVFVFYDKEGSCRPGRVTNKKMAMVRERRKGEIHKVERERYTVETIEHTVAMGKDQEGQLWTLFQVKDTTRKQPGSQSGEHLSTSLARLKPFVKYYIIKKHL